MSIAVGDFIVERLHAWGVRRIFAYPGDGINGVFGALNPGLEKIDFFDYRSLNTVEDGNIAPQMRLM